MSTLNIIRAWKEEDYRLSLSETERSQLPAHPAGLIELNAAELETAAGGLPPVNSYFTDCSLGWRCYSTSWSCG